MYLHRKPLPVPEAVARVMEYAWNGPSEIVPIGSCDGRILAVDVEATHPVPPFDKSPYDGFALKAGDTEGLSKDHPGNFHVLETIGAGARASRALREGEAVRIMTEQKCRKVPIVSLCLKFVIHMKKPVRIG